MDDDILYITNIDLFNSTSVFDIKPYTSVKTSRICVNLTIIQKHSLA
uniref:TsaA-like domain-containing protein n=1 Tax=Ignisphaera aggregans TaxID=334771 RepID=A0A832C9L5_9CREN